MKNSINIILLMVATVASSVCATYLIDSHVEKLQRMNQSYLVYDNADLPFKELPTIGFRSVNERLMQKSAPMLPTEEMMSTGDLLVPMNKRAKPIAPVKQEVVNIQSNEDIDSYSSAGAVTSSVHTGDIIAHNFIAMSVISQGVPQSSTAYLATVPAKRNINVGPPMIPDKDNDGNPDIPPYEDMIGPVGDGIWLLCFCAGGYLLCLTYRRKRRA